MRKLVSVVALASAGCVSVPPPAPEAEIPVHGEVPGYVCNDPGDTAVGQVATADLGARLLAESGARNLRWVAYGMMVTMDFQPSRLTVHLDAQNRVERISCG